MTRYAVIRVPSSGPPALIAAPNDFTTEAAALRRIAEVEARQRMAHHTHLEVLPYDGPLLQELARRGVIH